jgi:excisionase family DNA binding protein
MGTGGAIPLPFSTILLYTGSNSTGVRPIHLIPSGLHWRHMAKQYFTPLEVADMLKLNVATVYQAIRREQLAATKFGSRYRISEEQLEDWLSARATSS